MLKIYTVLCRAGKMDNYSYILHSGESGVTAVIDPSENAPIIKKLEELNLRPDFILNTHHHYDHTDGNVELKELYGAKVIANINDSARIPGFDIGVEPGKSYTLTPTALIPAAPDKTRPHCHAESVEKSQPLTDFSFTVIDASAHTQGHILYYFPQAKALFTGDTLFNLCIGGLFEGTAEQMFAALNNIRALPDDTLFYPGHEYTFGGAQEAYQYFNGNDDIRRYLEKAQTNLQKGLPAGPFTLAEEKKCNPYLAATALPEFKNLF